MPSSSGPRWRSAAIMSRKGGSRSRSVRLVRMPAMPHMRAISFLGGNQPAILLRRPPLRNQQTPPGVLDNSCLEAEVAQIVNAPLLQLDRMRLDDDGGVPIP